MLLGQTPRVANWRQASELATGLVMFASGGLVVCPTVSQDKTRVPQWPAAKRNAGLTGVE